MESLSLMLTTYFNYQFKYSQYWDYFLFDKTWIKEWIIFLYPGHAWTLWLNDTSDGAVKRLSFLCMEEMNAVEHT